MYQYTKNIQKIKKIKKQSYDGFFVSSGISSQNLKSIQIEIREKIIKIRERKKEIREIKIKIIKQKYEYALYISKNHQTL